MAETKAADLRLRSPKFLLTPKFVNNQRQRHTTSKKATTLRRGGAPAYLIHTWHAITLHLLC